MTTADAVSLFLASRRHGTSSKTISFYRSIFGKFTQHFSDLPATPEPIESWLGSIQGSDETAHAHFRCLRALYRFLHRRYGMVNPLELIDPPKVKAKLPKFLAPDELQRLLSYPNFSTRIHALLWLLADTGMRVGEAASAKGVTNNSWGLFILIDGKTGERMVPISAETARLLDGQLPFGVGGDRLGHLISAAMKQAGIPGSAHWLRHTFATLWEGPELSLMQILGHNSTKTLKRYRHLRWEMLVNQHHNFSPVHGMDTRQLRFDFTEHAAVRLPGPAPPDDALEVRHAMIPCAIIASPVHGAVVHLGERLTGSQTPRLHCGRSGDMTANETLATLTRNYRAVIADKLPPPGTPISLSEAERKYRISNVTLGNWARRGRIKTLQEPSGRGARRIVDEHDLAELVATYKACGGSMGKHIIRQTMLNKN